VGQFEKDSHSHLASSEVGERPRPRLAWAVSTALPRKTVETVTYFNQQSEATLLKQGVNESAANFNLTHYRIKEKMVFRLIHFDSW